MMQEHVLWQGLAGLESVVSLPALQAAACQTSGACMHDMSTNIKHYKLTIYIHTQMTHERKKVPNQVKSAFLQQMLITQTG